LGGLFLQLILNGIYKYNLPIAWQSILQGGIIVLATTFDAQFNKLSFGRRRVRPASPALKREGGV
jgi:ribose transport system permease protein